MNIRIILIIVFFLFVSKSYSTEWDPSDLVDYANEHREEISPNNKEYYLIDPDKYLSKKERESMFSLLDTILSKKDIKMVFIVVSETDRYYSSYEFTESFMVKFFNDHSLPSHVACFFDIVRHQMRIMTGMNARRKYTDVWCANALDKLKSNLRKELYYDSFSQLLNYFINQELISAKSFFDMNYLTLISIVIGAMIIISLLITILFIVLNSKDKKIQKIRSFLQSIKDSEMKLDQINSHCILCLEPLPKETTLDTTIQTLQCQHIFHKKCYSQWKKRNQSCPLCIQSFQALESNELIAKQIVNIQRMYVPQLFSYIFDSYKLKMKESTYCCKDCEGSGGRSSGGSWGGRSYSYGGRSYSFGGRSGGGGWGGCGGAGGSW